MKARLTFGCARLGNATFGSICESKVIKEIKIEIKFHTNNKSTIQNHLPIGLLDQPYHQQSADIVSRFFAHFIVDAHTISLTHNSTHGVVREARGGKNIFSLDICHRCASRFVRACLQPTHFASSSFITLISLMNVGEINFMAGRRGRRGSKIFCMCYP